VVLRGGFCFAPSGLVQCLFLTHGILAPLRLPFGALERQGERADKRSAVPEGTRFSLLPDPRTYGRG
jgi:hypothetical protein